MNAAMLNPFSLVRRRFRQWWQARLPLTDTLTLTQRNVYILPTRPGFMLGLTLLLLLVASINYQLNLGYLLTFLLAGSAVVGMHVCHATLRGLTLNLMAPEAQVVVGLTGGGSVLFRSGLGQLTCCGGSSSLFSQSSQRLADAKVRMSFSYRRSGAYCIAR